MIESSWVGLGWNLNPGAINRSVMDIQMIGKMRSLEIEIFMIIHPKLLTLVLELG